MICGEGKVRLAMNNKKEKLFAKTVQELYLYPYRSKGENALRGAAWITSWIVGIVLQQSESQQAVGGAYLIFSLSLLLEFVPEGRTRPISRAVHAVFCTMLFLMFLGSWVMIFGGPDDIESLPVVLKFLIKHFSDMGWIIIVAMFIAILLVFAEAHKYIYDDKNELQQITENMRESLREQFQENLSGTPTGRIT